IAWVSIGLASWRFRKAWKKQGRPIEDLKFRAAWTWPWGPYFVIIAVSCLIIIQGWSSVIPKFDVVEFFSFYIELPIMLVLTIAWMLIRRPNESKRRRPFIHSPDDSSPLTPLLGVDGTDDQYKKRKWWYHDLVDVDSVNLYRDEYGDDLEVDKLDNERRNRRLKGKARILWTLYYWIM
ncbi:hypothetical protein MPER_06345, partial [Moniliophthora perniciosa FA553]